MLMILLKILLWLVLILLAVILLILVVPIGYQASGRYAEGVKQGEGQISLFWGLIRLKASTNDFQHLEVTLTVAGISFRIPMAAAKKKSPKAHAKAETKTRKASSAETFQPPPSTAQKPPPSTAPEPPRKKPSFSFSEAMQHLRETHIRELMAVIQRFLQKIWIALRPQTFNIKVVYGMPDPYETAMINNCLMALFAVWPHQALQLQPVFHDSLVDVSGNIKGSLIPMAFLAAALQLMLAKPVRRIWWPLIKKHIRIRRNTHVNEFK
jgi:hypothetical protein